MKTVYFMNLADESMAPICLSCGEETPESELSGGWCAECNDSFATCENCGRTIDKGQDCGICTEELDDSYLELDDNRDFIQNPETPGRAAKTVKRPEPCEECGLQVCDECEDE